MLKWIQQLLGGWWRPNSTAKDVKWLLAEKKRREENKQHAEEEAYDRALDRYGRD
jgi:hypothetical protein